MRRSEFAGTGHVFRFTLAQYLKARSTILTMLLMVVVMIASVFIAGYSMGADDVSGIDCVSFINETGIPIDAGDVAAYDRSYYGLTQSAHDSCDAVVTIYEENGVYHIRAESDTAAADELARLENAVAGAFGVIASGREIYLGEAMYLGEYLTPEMEEDGFEASFTISYVYSILVMVLTMLSSSYIIRSVLEEKSSRLVEMLMVSVKPLALILGKILASMCLVVIQLALLAAGSIAAAKLAGRFMGGTGLMTMVMGTGVMDSLANLNAFSIIAALVSVLLGFFTLALIGGLSASCCDSMEDMNSASTASMFTALAGYMVGVFAGSFGSGAVSVFFSLLPIASVFVAPVKYLEGEISALVLVAAWILQLGVIALLAHITRKTYAALIMHTGSRIKLRNIMSFAGKGGSR